MSIAGQDYGALRLDTSGIKKLTQQASNNIQGLSFCSYYIFIPQLFCQLKFLMRAKLGQVFQGMVQDSLDPAGFTWDRVLASAETLGDSRPTDGGPTAGM